MSTLAAIRTLVSIFALRPQVERVESRVSLAVGLSRVRAGRCYACGAMVEPALLELGSPQCLDCGGTRGNEKGLR
jgi:hypothetical protein